MSRQSLVWKYFFEQKKDEILECLAPIIGFTCWVGLSFLFIGIAVSNNIMIYIGEFILSFWILVGVFKLLMIFREWIMDNWEIANDRADKELRKIKSKRGKK